MSSFKIMLDVIGHGMKPRGYEIADITRRLQRSKPIESTAGEFCEHVKEGRTWTGGCYEPTGESGWGRFVGQQIIGLDIDNTIEEEAGPGVKAKRFLQPGDQGFISEEDIISRSAQYGLEPLCIYPTFSSTPDNPRFRVVFDLRSPISSEEEAREVIDVLLDMFPEADQQCRNPNRLFFGTNGEVRICQGVEE